MIEFAIWISHDYTEVVKPTLDALAFYQTEKLLWILIVVFEVLL